MYIRIIGIIVTAIIVNIAICALCFFMMSRFFRPDNVQNTSQKPSPKPLQESAQVVVSKIESLLNVNGMATSFDVLHGTHDD